MLIIGLFGVEFHNIVALSLGKANSLIGDFFKIKLIKMRKKNINLKEEEERTQLFMEKVKPTELLIEKVE